MVEEAFKTGSDQKGKKGSYNLSTFDVKYVSIAPKLLASVPSYCSSETSEIFPFFYRNVKKLTRRADIGSEKRLQAFATVAVGTLSRKSGCVHGKVLYTVLGKPDGVCKGDGVCATEQRMLYIRVFNSPRRRVVHVPPPLIETFLAGTVRDCPMSSV